MATDNGQWLVACLAYGLMRRLMSCCKGAGVEVLSRGKGRVGTWLPPALPLHVPFPLSSPFCSRCFYYIRQLLRLRTGVMHVMATISSSHPCGKRWREILGWVAAGGVRGFAVISTWPLGDATIKTHLQCSVSFFYEMCSDSYRASYAVLHTESPAYRTGAAIEIHPHTHTHTERGTHTLNNDGFLCQGFDNNILDLPHT